MALEKVVRFSERIKQSSSPRFAYEYKRLIKKYYEERNLSLPPGFSSMKREKLKQLYENLVSEKKLT